MAVNISDPRTDVEGLNDLEPLWVELHRHHLAVSEYQPLVRDVGCSWARRLGFYRRLLAEGASYLTANDDRGRLIGYAMIGVEDGPDDTFDVKGGIAEVVTLVVTHELRSTSVGRSLLRAAEDFARDRGFGTVKVAVMTKLSAPPMARRRCVCGSGAETPFRNSASIPVAVGAAGVVVSPSASPAPFLPTRR